MGQYVLLEGPGDPEDPSICKLMILSSYSSQYLSSNLHRSPLQQESERGRKEEGA